jgi:alpha-L-fucosidase 2
MPSRIVGQASRQPTQGDIRVLTDDFWYSRPATNWVEALPVGNGRLGAMVFGGVAKERLQINDGTAWSGTPANERAEPVVTAANAKAAIARARTAVAAGHYADSDAALRTLQQRYTQSYLPFADLWLTTRLTSVAGESELSSYRRSLDLATALHSVEYELGGFVIRRKVFVSAPDEVLVMIIETEHPDGLDLGLSLGSELKVTLPDQMMLPNDTAGLLLRMPSDVSPPFDEDPDPVTYSSDDAASMHGAIVLGWVHDGMSTHRTPTNHLSATGVRRAVIRLATRTTFVGLGHPPVGTATQAFERALDTVVRATAQPVEALRERQRADHAGYFDRVDFTVAAAAGPAADRPVDERLVRANASGAGVLTEDPTLANLLFAYGRYLLISSSRPGGVPANLQGIWNDKLQAPWSGNYTTNVNVEMNYWQAEVANLSELAEPLFDLIEVLSIRGRETARRIYDAPGWVAHHNTDIWGYTQPVGRGRHEPRWAFWPLAGAWLLRHLWEHLLFGADDAFARNRAWGPTRSSAEFYLSWLVEAEDGTLSTSPSTSPENDFRAPDGSVNSSAASSTMDLVLIADVFRMTVAIAERLGIPDDPIALQAAAALAHIPAPPIGSDGGIAEWQGDFEQVDSAHRHLSHLYFAFPGDLPLSPPLRAAVIASLDRRGDEATGWSLAWKLALRARMREPERVSTLLNLIFRDMEVDRGAWVGGLYPNLLVAHPPFQIDGNLGFVAGIIECLLQSHNGVLEVMPAIPVELNTGTVTGLVARPGIVVDLQWADGDLILVRLRARSAASFGSHIVRYRGSQVTIELADREVLVRAVDFD